MKNLNLIIIAIAVTILFSANVSYGQHEHNGADTSKTDKVKDVVCGMEVAKNDSLRVFYNEKDYFFCSNKDMLAFLRQPQKYTGEQGQNRIENKTEEHKMDDSKMDHGMMGMSTPMMLIMGGVMVTAMIIGMTRVMR